LHMHGRVRITRVTAASTFLLVAAEVIESIEATLELLGRAAKMTSARRTASDLDRLTVHSAAMIDATTILLYDSLAGRMRCRTGW
jgi:hypothetical protein